MPDHNHPPHEPHPPRPPHHVRPAALDQMSDEEVMRFAPPEIRRLARRLADVENRLQGLQDTQAEILALLRRQASP